MAMEVKVAAETVREVLPEIPDSDAEIVVEPAFTALTSPLEPDRLEMTAIDGELELQVTAVVKSAIEESENVPVASYCCWVPLAIVVAEGVTAILCSVAAVTVSEVLPDIP